LARRADDAYRRSSALSGTRRDKDLARVSSLWARGCGLVVGLLPEDASPSGSRSVLPNYLDLAVIVVGGLGCGVDDGRLRSSDSRYIGPSEIDVQRRIAADVEVLRFTPAHAGLGELVVLDNAGRPLFNELLFATAGLAGVDSAPCGGLNQPRLALETLTLATGNRAPPKRRFLER
jgi:hypothetical protein